MAWMLINLIVKCEFILNSSYFLRRLHGFQRRRRVGVQFLRQTTCPSHQRSSQVLPKKHSSNRSKYCVILNKQGYVAQWRIFQSQGLHTILWFSVGSRNIYFYRAQTLPAIPYRHGYATPLADSLLTLIFSLLSTLVFHIACMVPFIVTST